jgi:glutathione peroxidase
MREGLKGHGLTPTQDPEVLWNFEKFLIGRDGKVVGRFKSAVAPNADELIKAIKTELDKPAAR